jgi:hypothetical protein
MNEEVKAVEMPDAKLLDARRCASAAMQEMSGDFRDDDNRALIRDVAVLAAHYALTRTPASCSPDVVELVAWLRRYSPGPSSRITEAADALESMMREKDAMREALKRAQEFIHDKFCGCSPDDPEHGEECVAARAALDMTLDKGR